MDTFDASTVVTAEPELKGSKIEDTTRASKCIHKGGRWYRKSISNLQSQMSPFPIQLDYLQLIIVTKIMRIRIHLQKQLYLSLNPSSL